MLVMVATYTASFSDFGEDGNSQGKLVRITFGYSGPFAARKTNGENTEKSISE